LLIGLAEHQSRWCIVCNPAAGQQCNGVDSYENKIHNNEASLSDKFEKLSTVVKSKSAIVKEKMINYIKNEPGSVPERHVSSEDRMGRRYRNMASVFTIDDDDEPDIVTTSSDDDNKPCVDLAAWIKRPDVQFTFECQAIDRAGETHISRLCITSTELYVLREPADRNGTARIQAERHLGSILKITSKKRHPEFITFKYGSNEEGKGLTVTAVDRFIIPRAGEATKCIKQQIMKVLESMDT